MKNFCLNGIRSSINFVGFKRYSIGISIVSTIISVLFICISGLNFGIDFVGGIDLEIKTSKTLDIAKLRETLSKLHVGEVSIQQIGDKDNLSIKIGNKSNAKDETEALVKKILSNDFDDNIEYRKVDFVGPQVGDYMIKSSLVAIVLSFVGIMFYVWLRFEWYFGVGTFITLVHDAIVSIGFMSMTGYDFNLSSVAGILTIIGYSVNDSVVIYDRIRENIKKHVGKSLATIINLSINETLSRTTITVLTTLLANLALIIYGGGALRSFSMLVFFGISVGTYSSIFVSALIPLFFQEKTVVC